MIGKRTAALVVAWYTDQDKSTSIELSSSAKPNL